MTPALSGSRAVILSCLLPFLSTGCISSLPPEDRAVVINSTISALISGAVKVATEDVSVSSACAAETKKLTGRTHTYAEWQKLILACQSPSTRVTTEAVTPICTTVDPRPSLWPRVPAGFNLTFRSEWLNSLRALPASMRGFDTGALQLNTVTRCWEILTIGGADPGYFWRPYDSRFDFISASKFNRYGPGVGGGHSHGNDGLVCSPAEWLNEIEHRTGISLLTCESIEVLDTWYNRGLFYSLMAQYNALHPQTPTPSPPVVPPVAPPPVMPPIVTPPSCPEGQACRAPCEVCKTCEPCKVCETCVTCSPLPVLKPIPSDVLATATHAFEWVADQTAKNPAKRKEALRRVEALHRLQDWLQAQQACQMVVGDDFSKVDVLGGLLSGLRTRPSKQPTKEQVVAQEPVWFCGMTADSTGLVRKVKLAITQDGFSLELKDCGRVEMKRCSEDR